MTSKTREPGKLVLYIIPAAVALFNLLIIFYPQDIIAAAKDGLGLWFNNVLPSLLPFIIGTNLLSGLGAISYLGTLLEPVMQPLFGVPGCGGFALITGMTSGYPMGAKVTAALRRNEQVTAVEAQRLLAFCNNSGPLFILGAVGIGMFQSAKAGYFLMLVHYCAAIITGLLFKYYKYRKSPVKPTDNRRIFTKASRAMKDARMKDGRSIGQLLGDSVSNAMESTLQIGGFIVLFCVLVKALEVTNIIDMIVTLASPFMGHGDTAGNILSGMLYGIMEVTNGTRALAAGPVTQAHLTGAAVLISFGGFSIYAQSINFTAKTDIKALPYLLSKVLQAVITFVLCGLVYPLFDFSSSAETVAAFTTTASPFRNLYYSTIILGVSLIAVTVFAIFLNTAIKINRKRNRYG